MTSHSNKYCITLIFNPAPQPRIWTKVAQKWSISISPFFPSFGLVEFPVATDDLVEGVECLLLALSVNETVLDPRDQGQVDFYNNVSLIRIEDLIGKP